MIIIMIVTDLDMSDKNITLYYQDWKELNDILNDILQKYDIVIPMKVLIHDLITAPATDRESLIEYLRQKHQKEVISLEVQRDE